MEGGLVKQSEILESHRFGIRTRSLAGTQWRADISTLDPPDDLQALQTLS